MTDQQSMSKQESKHYAHGQCTFQVFGEKRFYTFVHNLLTFLVVWTLNVVFDKVLLHLLSSRFVYLRSAFRINLPTAPIVYHINIRNVFISKKLSSKYLKCTLPAFIVWSIQCKTSKQKMFSFKRAKEQNTIIKISVVIFT